MPRKKNTIHCEPCNRDIDKRGWGRHVKTSVEHLRLAGQSPNGAGSPRKPMGSVILDQQPGQKREPYAVEWRDGYRAGYADREAQTKTGT